MESLRIIGREATQLIETAFLAIWATPLRALSAPSIALRAWSRRHWRSQMRGLTPTACVTALRSTCAGKSTALRDQVNNADRTHRSEGLST